MEQTTSELRLPAKPEFILVAKRAAAGFACVAGFDIEGIDDVVIAVTQACQNAIACGERSGGFEGAELRLTFSLKDHRLEVQVRSVRSTSMAGSRERAASVPSRAIAAAKQAAEEKRVAEQRQAEAAAATDLALRVMGLFVDDYGYRVDERTGGLRVRLTKYRGR